MKTINEQIAIKVMGWKMVSSPTKITSATYALGHTNRDIANVFIPDWGNRIKPFKPDTSPADAFEVLKACAKMSPNSIRVQLTNLDGKDIWIVSRLAISELGDTLQAAICAFALKVFP